MKMFTLKDKKNVDTESTRTLYLKNSCFKNILVLYYMEILSKREWRQQEISLQNSVNGKKGFPLQN